MNAPHSAVSDLAEELVWADRRPGALDGGYRRERLVPVSINLVDHCNRSLAAGGVDPAQPRVEGQVVNVARDRHAGHDLPGVAVHDDQCRILPAADEEPMVGLVDGHGGVIVLNRVGQFGVAFNTRRMARAYMNSGMADAFVGV